MTKELRLYKKRSIVRKFWLGNSMESCAIAERVSTVVAEAVIRSYMRGGFTLSKTRTLGAPLKKARPK